MPLQIYLDSSDFSNLSNLARQADYEHVKRFLLNARDRGEIEIRFSYAHVVEAAPTALEHLPFAIARFRSIQELCGPRCLVDPPTIIRHEFPSDHGNPLPSLLRDDGDWCPSFSGTLELPDLGALLQESLSSLPGPERRRKVRQLFDTKGQLRPRALRMVRERAEAILASMQREYPMTAEATRSMERFVVGVGSEAEANRALRDSIKNLEQFAQWHAREWETTSKFSAWLRIYGENIRRNLSHTAGEVRTLYQAELASGRSGDVAKKLLNEGFNRASANFAQGLVKSLHGAGLEGAANATPSWTTSPGLMCIASVAVQAFRRTALDPTQSRKARTSDFGDVCHCIYLPYVDVFRADGFAATAISDADMPVRALVAPNLMQLPDVIRRALSSN
ncbi:hypothetical protein [Variovorax soli]|uniref:Uncharacterized protein n=1 Tax=Variovorax soli TaxID=376815 RepID=A0ABU1NEU4_9BURK|nr:hypothetical protein [Variovorax soli]MDR6536980.1 hypothetical protein [Variovorax soli]